MLFPHSWRNWESIHSCYQSKLRPERGCVLRITLFGALAQQSHQSGVKCLFVETVGSAFVQHIWAARMCRFIVKPSNEAHEMLLERKIDLREGQWPGGKPLAVHTELESGFLLALYISFSWHVDGAVAETVEWSDSNQKPDCMETSNEKESFFQLTVSWYGGCVCGLYRKSQMTSSLLPQYLGNVI